MKSYQILSISIILLFTLSAFGQHKRSDFYNLKSAFENPLSVKILDLRFKDLSHLPDSISKFENLEVLLIANNNIKELPSNIAKLSKLKEIDLSDNKQLNYEQAFDYLGQLKKLKKLHALNMPSMPNSILHLSNLEQLDLSNCKIEHPFKLVQLERLKSLTIKHCKIDSADLFFATLGNHNNLRQLTIFDDEATHLPNSISGISSLRYLEVQGAQLKSINENLTSLSKLKTIRIYNSPNLLFEPLADQLKEIRPLRNISIQSCNLSQIPASLNAMPHLSELILSGNNINTVPDEIKGMKGLAYLDIRGNSVALEGYKKIKHDLPNCVVLTDERVMRKKIEAPLGHIKVATQSFIVNPDKPAELKTKSGSKISIPSNAFLDENGQIVKGEVVVEYEEYTNAVDVFLSGIPMEYNHNGVNHSFTSAGMFMFNAFQNDKNLYANPNPKSQVSVDLISYNNDDNMDLYQYDEVKEGWVKKMGDNQVSKGAYIGKPYAPLKPLNDSVLAKPLKPILPYPVKPKFHYPIRSARLFVMFDDLGKDKIFKIKVPANPHGAKSGKYHYKAFLDVEYLNPYHWVCDENSLEGYKKFESMIKRDGNVTNIEIEPVDSKDYYTLFIYFNMDIVKVNATPKPNSDSDRKFSYSHYKGINSDKHKLWATIDEKHDIAYQKHLGVMEKFKIKADEANEKQAEADKRFEQVYADYEIRLGVFNAGKEKVMEEYEIDLANYNKKMEEWVELEISSVYSPERKKKRNVRQAILTGFGIWNADRIDFDRDESILAKMKDEDKNVLAPKFVYVLDDDRSSVAAFFGDQEITYKRRNTNALIALLEDDQYGYVNPKEFKKYTRGLFPKRSLKTSMKNISDTTLDEFRDHIAAN